MTVTLNGLTWDHPRGYAPLIGGAPEYEKQNPGVKIHWDRRTLREFGEAPIEQYLPEYDLIVVDHPFVGFAAAHDVLVDLSSSLTEREKRSFAQDSVGPSWESYWYKGRLWAFPIDAATQVASYRRHFLTDLPDTLTSAIEMGKELRKTGKFIAVAACPTDAISLFFTLTASLGYPIAEDGDPFVETAVGHEVLGLLHELVAVSHPKSTEWNPIQVYDCMVSSTDVVYCPYAFGYSNYARKGLSSQLKFSNAPAAGSRGCAGTMLGGTGVAVSSASAHGEQAIAYAKWLTTPEHQRGTYFREGGQPASLGAWLDADINDASNHFFRETLLTLQTAYLRPRFDGFVGFFESAGIEINRCLRGERTDEQVIRFLNEYYSKSQTAQLTAGQRNTA